MKLLALDVGNTSVACGVFEGSRLLRVGRWPIALARLDAPGLAARAARFARLKSGERAAIACASVVPEVDKKLKSAFSRRCKDGFVFLTPRSPIGLKLKVRFPGQVGADRIANALAAAKLVQGACIVVDFGTATTFDCLSRRGEYLGGAILPGPMMSARALAERTAKLPEAAVRKPKCVIGRDTVGCLQAGLYYGYLGMIERLLERTLEEMRSEGWARANIKILLTGGYARLYAHDLPQASYCPDLTLQGVRIFYNVLKLKACGLS